MTWRKTSAMVVKDSASKLEQKRVKNKALKDVCVIWKEHKDKEGGLASGMISEMISEKYKITISAGTVWRKIQLGKSTDVIMESSSMGELERLRRSLLFHHSEYHSPQKEI
eukprot:10383575-Ditylum_brightwellii.AAC.1